MLNDNKNDFMYAAIDRMKDFRAKSYENCMETFCKKCILDSTTVKLPKDVTIDDKEAIKENVVKSIADSAKRFVNNGLVDESSNLHNVDIAHDIDSPKDLGENIQKLLAEHVYDEAKDRIDTLSAQFDAGITEKMTSEEALAFIDKTFEDLNFDVRYPNGRNLKAKLNTLLSTEGQELVASIKADVNKLITETEDKNSVIREAVSEINNKKADIERQINGEADDANEDKDKTKDELDKEKATEGWIDRAKKNKGYSLSKEDLYTTMGYAGKIDTSSEALSRTFDETSFSRESAEAIMSQFRELDGVDDHAAVGDDNAQSFSNDDATSSISDDGDDTKESAENDYYDDDGQPIEINSDLFKYEDEITPEPLSEESMARDFIPLSPKTFWNRNVNPNMTKMAAYFTLTKSKGKTFFDQVKTRGLEMVNLLSTEDQICDSISNDEINKKLTDTLGLCSNIEAKTEDLLEKMGICGILADNYQRTDSPVQNAVNSLFNPTIIGTNDKSLLSKEELHEHELAEILKLGIKIADVKNDIVSGIDVIGNKDHLGYLEELLNEKMFAIDDSVEKDEIKSKVDALQSIECQIPISEIVNMKVFLSKDADNSDRKTIDTLKDVEAYGFKYDDLVNEIKANVKKTYKEKFEGKYSVINFNVDDLVEFVLEEQDTTKIKPTLYEAILAKFTEKVDSFANSTEAAIVNNRARVITTAVVTMDKLGYLSDNEFNKFKYSLM
jgi:hypothetical protein